MHKCSCEAFGKAIRSDFEVRGRTVRRGKSLSSDISNKASIFEQSNMGAFFTFYPLGCSLDFSGRYNQIIAFFNKADKL